MSREITHIVIDGKAKQIVSPERLQEILNDDGESYERPKHFGTDDEWNLPEECDQSWEG